MKQISFLVKRLEFFVITAKVFITKMGRHFIFNNKISNQFLSAI